MSALTTRQKLRSQLEEQPCYIAGSTYESADSDLLNFLANQDRELFYKKGEKVFMLRPSSYHKKEYDEVKADWDKNRDSLAFGVVTLKPAPNIPNRFIKVQERFIMNSDGTIQYLENATGNQLGNTTGKIYGSLSDFIKERYLDNGFNPIIQDKYSDKYQGSLKLVHGLSMVPRKQYQIAPPGGLAVNEGEKKATVGDNKPAVIFSKINAETKHDAKSNKDQLLEHFGPANQEMSLEQSWELIYSLPREKAGSYIVLQSNVPSGANFEMALIIKRDTLKREPTEDETRTTFLNETVTIRADSDGYTIFRRKPYDRLDLDTAKTLKELLEKLNITEKIGFKDKYKP